MMVHFEVTQLLATFLIAVAHPRERKLERELNDLRVDDAVSYFGLPRLKDIHYKSRPEQKRPPNVSEVRVFDPNAYLGDQIEILRNAVVHGNVVFSSSGGATEDINEIRLLNIHRGRERDRITTTFEQLEEYTRICIEIADHFFEFRDLTRAVFGERVYETGIIEWPK